ncbi:MAG: DDB1- and CUL4-associated factor 12 [Paramarteilia canceri]
MKKTECSKQHDTIGHKNILQSSGLAQSIFDMNEEFQMTGQSPSALEKMRKILINRSPGFVLPKMKEYSIDLADFGGSVNKIFSSVWISNDIALLGTKCNRIFILNFEKRNNQLKNENICSINIHTFEKDRNKDILDFIDYDLYANGSEPNGVRAMEFNKNTNLLAVSHDDHCLSIYNPINRSYLERTNKKNLELISTSESGHSDVIFDIKWLNDTYLVSGSRDSTLTFWNVAEDEQPSNYDLDLVAHTSISSPNIDKVRSIAVKPSKEKFVTTSLNSIICLWDSFNQKTIHSVKFKSLREMTCSSYVSQSDSYAVGCCGSILQVDFRAGDHTNEIIFEDSNCGNACINLNKKLICLGARSIELEENILSIGTTDGYISFFDLRNEKFIKDNGESSLKLGCSNSFFNNDELSEIVEMEGWNINEFMKNAIYTHKYRPPGYMTDGREQILIAGGPIVSSIRGYCTSLWKNS